MERKLHDYQKRMVEHILENKYCGIFLDMGLGKTVITLTALEFMMYSEASISKILVIAPLKVADIVWEKEIKEWSHLKHITYSKVLGTPAQRKKALNVQADIYIINRENVCWLVDLYENDFPFDVVVIDELSSFKNHKVKRFRALKLVRSKIKRIIGLTGTPASNGLEDLWSQLYLLDRGERLGRFLGAYRREYFSCVSLNLWRNNRTIFKYTPKQGSKEVIFKKIGDICVSMRSKDYIKLPTVISKDIKIPLTPEELNSYMVFEEEQVLDLIESNKTIKMQSFTNKLSQYANGAVYDKNKEVLYVHDHKLDVLEEIIDCAAKQPVLVFYNFIHDYKRIIKRCKKYEPRKLETAKDIEDWNAGKIKVLLAHPASCGHGLNLQTGGNIIIWFGLTWSLELYQQANARLIRQGQIKNVIVHHLIAKGTVDEDILKVLRSKAAGQEALLNAVKLRISRYQRRGHSLPV